MLVMENYLQALEFTQPWLEHLIETLNYPLTLSLSQEAKTCGQGMTTSKLSKHFIFILHSP